MTFFASNQVISAYPYNEKFDVLYSTEGNDTADFKVLKNDSINGTVRTETGVNWKQFSYDIPDGAKYFAIHHKSPIGSCYLFGVDDINFEKTSLGTNDSIVAYNIYRNGELVVSVDGNTLSFTDDKAEAGVNLWNVSVVYQSKDSTRNESSFSNDATLSTNGISNITVDGDATYNVYTIDGRNVRLNAKSLSGLKPGVYIVNGIKQLLK